jgi:hypothetical protein
MRRIIEVQRIIREAGRIRTGEQVPSGKGRRPAKLENFRLTSPFKDVLEQCAEQYGGTIREWENAPGTAMQWELYTERAWLDVIVPPEEFSFSLCYELWNAGGCVRRCSGKINDSEDNMIEGIVGAECVCNPDNRECQLTTRLSVFLPDIETLGLWRLESRGYYAAAEMSGTVELLNMAAARGVMLPAVLRLDQRSSKRIVKGKSETNHYVVPVLDVRISVRALMTGHLEDDAVRGALEPVTAAGLVPISTPPVSVREAIEDVSNPAPRPARKNAATPVKPTGRKPRARGAAAGSPDPGTLGDTITPNKPAGGVVEPVEGAEGESLSMDEARGALRARFNALPDVVSAEVKRDWAQLGYPSLRAAKGWDVEKIEWATRLAGAAEDKANALLVAARQRCATMTTRDLGWSDDQRHAWVESFTGKPGLTALDLNMLGKVEVELERLIEGKVE